MPGITLLLSIMNIFGDIDRFECKSIVYSQPSQFGPRLQQDLQLVYVYEGDMKVQVGRHVYRVGAGEATLLTPGHEEIFHFAQQSETRHGWCLAGQPRSSSPLIRQLEGRPDVLPFTPDMRDLATMAMSVSSQPEGSRLYRDALIKSLLLSFIHRTGCLDDEQPVIHPSLARAIRYIEDSPPGPMTVVDMARAAGVTPNHLIRLFKSGMGVTPKEYFWKQRTGKAAQLLRETGLSAAEIAYRTGFANPHHFSRVFTKYQHTTPGRFRKDAWSRNT